MRLLIPLLAGAAVGIAVGRYLVPSARAQVVQVPSEETYPGPKAARIARDLLATCEDLRPLAEALVRAGEDGAISGRDLPTLARHVYVLTTQR